MLKHRHGSKNRPKCARGDAARGIEGAWNRRLDQRNQQIQEVRDDTGAETGYGVGAEGL